MQRTRKLGEDIQQTVSNERSGGCGYTSGRHGGFLSTVLQLLKFKLW